MKNYTHFKFCGNGTALARYRKSCIPLNERLKLTREQKDSLDEHAQICNGFMYFPWVMINLKSFYLMIAYLIGTQEVNKYGWEMLLDKEAHSYMFANKIIDCEIIINTRHCSVIIKINGRTRMIRVSSFGKSHNRMVFGCYMMAIELANIIKKKK